MHVYIPSKFMYFLCDLSFTCARSLLAVRPCETGVPASMRATTPPLQDPANVVPARHKFPDPAESSPGDAHRWLVRAGTTPLL